MKYFFWPSALFLALVTRAVFQVKPELTESIYTRGLFAGIRWLLDHTLGLLPFPLVYLLFGMLLWVLGRFIFSLLTMTGKDAMIRLGFFTLNTITGLGTLFLVLWGFNYCRLPVEKQLGLEVNNPSTTALRTEFERQTAVVLNARTKLQYDTATAIPELMVPLAMESDIRGLVENKYKELGLPAAGRPRGREPFWNGFFAPFRRSRHLQPIYGRRQHRPRFVFF